MTLEDIYRQEWGQVVATLIRVTGDWELAEECAQEAFAAALQRWPVDGLPDRPGAWLTTTARNRAIDWLRREAVGAAKMREVVALEDDQDPPYDVPDDRLRLMFTCCHPALAMEARVALTLRTLAGLSTAEIARAFLVPETTMSKRLTRAKQMIQHAGIPYRVPPAHLLPQRTPAVLAVLYLLFNEGYSDVVRSNLSGEAIRLARLLVQLMPDPEPVGLLALMLLHDARRDTRLADDGALVTLDDQDRSSWDHSQIKEGVDLLESALDRGAPGPYQVQAAIAACHATAPTAADTDWPQIAGLYAQLPQTPVVTLNRAVAIGMSDSPAVGLHLVEELSEGPLAGYHLLPATRADFLRRLERWPDAKTAYQEALELATTDAERLYLKKRLREVSVRS
ncbi:RNA polymerase sigma-70 factor (ECF subfamily) [Kribbella rubisoli]|uniref:RNA polymerase sigma-70 factor (ECF subfamily) n=1 Tax=Kribbella rubisoli TaxID=3075929 RepID=A0A4Q7W2I3_9ACTN|nr:RNA polymerase sigma factor [Kribbella rubisoli]RZU03185.1 RNA polymerase sigma-70 factor (ECF subfamily) [Kribbella rubisoli]